MHTVMTRALDLVLITNAQKPHLHAHADLSSLARGFTFNLSMYIHHNLVHTISEGSGETAHMRRLA